MCQAPESECLALKMTPRLVQDFCVVNSGIDAEIVAPASMEQVPDMVSDIDEFERLQKWITPN